jgi:hypothetical protein
MNLSPLLLRLMAAFLLVSFLGAANATTIFRWVDRQGKTHFSDVVPQAYKAIAKPVDQPAVEPSPQERRTAIERAAEQKADASKAPAAALRAGSAMPTAPPNESQGMGKRPAKAPTEDTDCETWKRLFQESSECFGPYNLVGGGIKKEAYEHCTPVVRPPLRCEPINRQ